jgi:hypothetical protein
MVDMDAQTKLPVFSMSSGLLDFALDRVSVQATSSTSPPDAVSEFYMKVNMIHSEVDSNKMKKLKLDVGIKEVEKHWKFKENETELARAESDFRNRSISSSSHGSGSSSIGTISERATTVSEFSNRVQQTIKVKANRIKTKNGRQGFH